MKIENKTVILEGVAFIEIGEDSRLPLEIITEIENNKAVIYMRESYSIKKQIIAICNVNYIKDYNEVENYVIVKDSISFRASFKPHSKDVTFHI